MLELKTIIAMLEGRTLVPNSHITIDVNSFDAIAITWIAHTLQNRNCPEGLSITFTASVGKLMPDDYFQRIVNTKVMKAYPEQLKLTFSHALIDSDIVLSLLRFNHCPRGLSLHFINCRDRQTGSPLNLCTDVQQSFANALKTNYAIISFDIRNDEDFVQSTDITRRNRKLTAPSYNNLVWQFHKATRRNRVIFKLLQFIRQKNDKALKVFLNKPNAFDDLLKLLKECPSPRTEDLFFLLKAYMHFSSMQLAEAWMLLTESSLTQSSSRIYQRKIKAFLSVLLDAYVARHDTDSYSNKEEFDRARCQYLLWLFCDSNFRSDAESYATVKTCLQLMQGKSVNPHESLTNIIGKKRNLLISYAEFCETAFGRKPNSAFEFNSYSISLLKDPIIQGKLIEKYGTCQIAVVEHLICESSRLPLKATIQQAEQILKSEICSGISASQRDENQATNTVSATASAAR